jgi:hypothetical protein
VLGEHGLQQAQPAPLDEGTEQRLLTIKRADRLRAPPPAGPVPHWAHWGH